MNSVACHRIRFWLSYDGIYWKAVKEPEAPGRLRGRFWKPEWANALVLEHHCLAHFTKIQVPGREHV